MALTSGTRLGPYAIAAQIGVGGMEEVEPSRFQSIPGRDGSRLRVSWCWMVGDEQTGCSRLARV